MRLKSTHIQKIKKEDIIMDEELEEQITAETETEHSSGRGE